METLTRATPVTPQPEPGQGGPVADLEGPANGVTPVIPLPEPGQGGPVADLEGPADGATPVIPLPNPGEGGPVADLGDGSITIQPGRTQVRFLNAAFGYPAFRILVGNTRVVRVLNYAALTAYGRIASGYQTITVTGTDGYIYLRKTLPFSAGTPTTVAVINNASGLDLLQISDRCCPAPRGFATFRVSNLARNSRPMDVLLADGRVVFTDVRFKETTVFKRMRPGRYQFFFAETDLSVLPEWTDIETPDSAFLGLTPSMETAASLYLNAAAGVNYTIFLLASAGSVNAIQTLTAADR